MIKKWQKVLRENLTIKKRVDNWVDYYRSHAVVMSPRGNARAAFRTAEVLQMGLIPLIAFNEWRWVPYLNSSFPWKDIGFHAINSEIPRVSKEIIELTEERLAFMRQTVRKYRDTHFTMEATINQIGLFMKSGYEKSDLRCDKFYPET